jgi:hypothetical protein
MKKNRGILAPSDTPVAESHFFNFVQEISNFIESNVTGQDIYTYAFHISLK